MLTSPYTIYSSPRWRTAARSIQLLVEQARLAIHSKLSDRWKNCLTRAPGRRPHVYTESMITAVTQTATDVVPPAVSRREQQHVRQALPKLPPPCPAPIPQDTREALCPVACSRCIAMPLCRHSSTIHSAFNHENSKKREPSHSFPP
jgi:hypothetical protein